MTCSTNSLKILSLIADVIFMIIGLCVFAFGVYTAITVSFLDVAPYFIVAFGIILTLVAIFGTLAALRESSRLSKTFVVSLIILIVVELLVIIFLWVFKTTALIIADSTFDELWRNPTTPLRPDENVNRIADIEKMLHCCGESGKKDYFKPPQSCFTNNVVLHEEGCRQKFLDFFSEGIIYTNIFGLVLIAVELICAALAYVLANSIVNRWRRSKYYTK